MFFTCKYAALVLPIRAFTSASDPPCSSMMLPKYIDNLIERLTNEKLPNLSSTNSFTNSISYMKCNANKLQEIIEHLTSDNLSKLPIESTLARKYLDFNRYDYGCSLKSQIRPIMKKLTKKEIHHVIERLTQYDINKYPPESNGHMIKK
ncbi:unnamed protein product [Schistosoma mattheei]|uniref:Uncharacterized protein n=1 Tax=Schistosoma mattheei TaxID=31246 RepID=A0A183PW84_9TREM|nr:unnamed protein product [Schistosoma mattheei]